MRKTLVFQTVFAISALALTFWLPGSQALAQSVNPPQGLKLSIEGYNDTQNQNVSTAKNQREDFLTFKLTTVNAGTLPQNYAPEVSLAGLLPLVNLVDKGGATLNGQQLLYPVLNLQAGQSRTNMFRVRIKYALPPFRYVGSINYGNAVEFQVASLLVGGKDGNYVPPETGANTTLLFASLFGLALTFSVFSFRKYSTKS